MTTRYRAEVVGSILRPPYLSEARESLRNKEISSKQYKRVEDRAVVEALALQENAGMDVVTDGESRRLGWTDSLVAAIEGVSPIATPPWRWHGKQSDLEVRWPVTITGKIRRKRSLATEEFAFARGKATKPIKMTLPSPLILGPFYVPGKSAAAYPDPFALFADGMEIVRGEARELAELGCEYIQIDAPELATLCDPAVRENFYPGRGISSERMLGEGIELLNAIPGTPGVTFAMHLCRGNLPAHWMGEGGYDAISKQVFTRATNFDVFLLEYDDWRSGSFEPLADIPKDKTVVLGLVSTKNPTIESAADLSRRVDEASRYHPREMLALSTQCGFASVAGSSGIGTALQEAKLRLVADVAHQLWR